MSAPFITSRLLPFAHGFSTREGGVSQGPFASLNLGLGTGDDDAAVEENLARLMRAAGLSLRELATATQVHGDQVLRAQAAPGAGQARSLGEADALWACGSQVGVGVRTADCVPILLVDEGLGAVAAVHSGWRGTEAMISLRAVQALEAIGARSERLLAAVGPSIGPCCYRVSEELAARFAGRFGPEVVRRGGFGPHLDLWSAVRRTLEGAGLSPQRVEVLERCTHCEPEMFFSHRRDGGITGRHLSFIRGPIS